jgi:hypothetical protein
MRNAGEVTHEAFEKSYRDFKGEDFAKSVAGKILNVHRLTDLNVNAVRTALIQHVERVNAGLCEKVTILALDNASSVSRDLLQEIAELRASLTEKETQLEQHKTNANENARHETELKKERTALLEKKRVKEAELDQLSIEIDKSLRRHASFVALANGQHAKADALHMKVAELNLNEGHHNGVIAYLAHQHRRFGFPPNPGDEVGINERARVPVWQQKVKTLGDLEQTNAAFAETMTAATTEYAALGKLLDQRAVLLREIRDLDELTIGAMVKPVKTMRP